MTNPRLEDHLVGLELQLVELVEQKQRAEVQGRNEDAKRLDGEVSALQAELAATAETISEGDEVADADPHAELDAAMARDILAA